MLLYSQLSALAWAPWRGGAEPVAANITLLAGAIDRTLEPGVHLECHGPFKVPDGAGALVRLLPEVDMSVVHHLIMYGRPGTPTQPYMADSPTCGGHILYAWARTGQTASGPIGLDFRDTALKGDAYPVGDGTATGQVSLQIHYQQMKDHAVVDNSGVRLWFSPEPPRRPLKVTLMMSTEVLIPPRAVMDECVVCRVEQGGHVVGYRNHAHRLARDVYSEHSDSKGVLHEQLGRISSQQPQIIRLLDKERHLAAGDTLQLHCQYDATDTARVTTLGLDERTQEMCNQYLVSTSSLQVECASEAVGAPRPAFKSAFAAAVGQYGAAHGGGSSHQLGQVTGVAAADDGSIYLIHRGTNSFFSTAPMTMPAILHVGAAGEYLGALRGAPFVVPHGLSIDHRGALWATDVATHTVYRIDKTTGAVQLSIGTGRPGSGAKAFNKPTDVAVSERTSEVYVADGYGNSRIAVFTYDGRFVRQWGSAGSGPGQFRVPHSITLDARGRVYVADRENARVQVFDASGAHLDTWVSKAQAQAQARTRPLSNAVWSRHVSSISYSKQLDVLAVVEGGDVVLRTTSGCVVLSSAAKMQWPHDAVVLPHDAAAARGVLAGASEYKIYVAEMEAHRLVMLASADRPAEAQTTSMY